MQQRSGATTDRPSYLQLEWRQGMLRRRSRMTVQVGICRPQYQYLVPLLGVLMSPFVRLRHLSMLRPWHCLHHHVLAAGQAS